MLTLLIEKLFAMDKEKYADIAIKARLNSKSRKHRTFSRTKFKKSKSPKFSRDSAPEEDPSDRNF